MFNRRRFLQISAAAPFMKGARARADASNFAHAASLFNDVKYPAGFKNFDYVNPAAPKGGRVHLALLGTFDSLNPHTIKGDPAAVGVLDTLMVSSLDEPFTKYGLIAEGISFPEDKSQVTFRLNAAARFHDGHPITPDDVIFSMATLKANLPQYQDYYKNVGKVEQTADHDVTFFFTEKNNRELPLIVAELAVLPKHWWSGNGPDGKPRDTNGPSLEIPLGSGAYKIVAVKPGSSITMQRVEDYWARDLAPKLGQENFDSIEYDYYQNRQVSFEGFKAGQDDYQYETSSKQWATGYDFAAVNDGRVVKELIDVKQPHGMQAFVLNLRRPKFQDIRVRQAMILAFDFDWSNANLFYGQYQQSRSFFNASEMEAKGLPTPDELALLEPLKDQVPPEVFTTEYQNPHNPDATARRKNLRAAAALLDAAGWKAQAVGSKNVLKNDKGETFSVEFTLDDPTFERITLPYKEQLELLGFVVTVRTLDDAQMTKIRQTFDFDAIVASFPQSLSPGNEQREFFGSTAADKQGSRNYAGIKNPAIDALIEKLIFAKDRAALVAACRALDRVLIWNAYMIPQWFTPHERVAFWNRFGKPDKVPDYGGYTSIPSYWWWDDAKAKKTAG